MTAFFEKLLVDGRQTAAHSCVPRLLLVALVCGTFLLGGSAREDAISLLLLRPFTAAVFVLALAIALPAAWCRARGETMVAGAILLLLLAQLLPLPPSIWTALPGRTLAVEIYRAAGVALPWHALSLTPGHSWNALFSLLGPIAAFLLALSLSPADLRRLTPVLLLCGATSALISMFQILGVQRLYFYQITNEGTAVGLFANRNHNATLIACLLPLLALYARTAHGRSAQTARVAAGAGGLVLVPLALLAGSRSGLICFAAALYLAWWVHGSGRGLLRTRIVVPAMTVITGAMGALFFLYERAPALLRLARSDSVAELRLRAAPVIWDAVRDYWPWGSGIGSFAEIYLAREPQALLSPAYLNHAHNEVLELLLTGGLPAAILLIAGLLLILLRGWSALGGTGRAFRTDDGDGRPWARAGLSLMLILLLASLVDYPLRTPILAMLMALAIAFIIWGHADHER